MRPASASCASQGFSNDLVKTPDPRLPRTGLTVAAVTTALRDLKEWCDALQGANEATGSTKQGAMVGGRGCVHKVGSEYMVTVAWQGLTPISAPPTSVTCGSGEYNSTVCTNDTCRRVVTTLVRIAAL